jgi:hypothetical protein
MVAARRPVGRVLGVILCSWVTFTPGSVGLMRIARDLVQPLRIRAVTATPAPMSGPFGLEVVHRVNLARRRGSGQHAR